MELDLRPSGINLHDSLIRDLEERIGTKDLPSWLDLEAERLARLGASDEVWNIAFSDELLSSRGIVAIEAAEIRSDARIVPVALNKYKILYKKGLPAFAPYYPRRFAIAHEIGHTYWFAPDTEGLALSPVQRQTGPDRTIEILCNRFAASLLLPKTKMLRAIELLTKGKVSPLPLHVLPVLSEYFMVAERAVAQRLFFYLRSDLKAIVCLRSRNDSGLPGDANSFSWVSSWCALPSDVSEREFRSGKRIPLEHPRVIPAEMIPEVPLGRTVSLDLDARWWQVTELMDNSLSKKPFAKMNRPFSKFSGFACRTSIKFRRRRDERIYLGLLR